MDNYGVLAKYKLESFVSEVFVLENDDKTKETRMPFYADGYPGIMFQQTASGVLLMPKNKFLSEFFMYGQTIQPIEIVVRGAYRMLVFQLYPFAAKSLFGVNPKELNDDCYDLHQVGPQVKGIVQQLAATKVITEKLTIIADFLSQLAQSSFHPSEQLVQLAIHLIMDTKGKITVKELTEKLYTTERTLQRRFSEHVGVSPKQFAKIIQFQSSFSQISDEAFSRLTEVVYENGYADQSHFIRNFKKYTDKKPSQFKSK